MLMNTPAELLIEWQRKQGRHDLPWQMDRTPYRVWVSEIMLQQTQVATVRDFFLRFMARFPTVLDLAAASQDEVFALWSGLGYYRRAYHLHCAARRVVSNHGGFFPSKFEDLTALPGIGPSTAGAILSLGFGSYGVILDGNVKRVLSRVCLVKGPYNAATMKTLWRYADEYTPKKFVDVYNQGMMDLGATICLRKSPLCAQCPWMNRCAAYANGVVDVYPGKLNKPKVSYNEKYLWIHEYQGKVWLECRPMSGIWGGMWSFPIEDKLNDSLGVCDKFSVKPRVLPIITHRFTHQVWRIQPNWLSWKSKPNFLTESGGWYHPSEAVLLGLPKPIRDILHGMCFDGVV
jgi:A/G-specific adenine glycosylase